MKRGKKSKKDDYITKYEDIEKEIETYYDYDNDVFRNKVVFLPCDDPETSNLTKYFKDNFDKFGIKELVSTGYAIKHDDEINILDVLGDYRHKGKDEINYHGKVFIMRDESGNGHVKHELDYLGGDGDYRSGEVTRIRDKADIIVANPPASLFKDFMRWVDVEEKKFIILGSVLDLQYKEIFNHVHDGIIKLGSNNVFSFNNKDGKEEKVSCCVWYTNIGHTKEDDDLKLRTAAENLRDNVELKSVLKRKFKENDNKLHYVEYENYDAIDAPYCSAIPSDYDGNIGVPITFLLRDKFKEYEVIKFKTGYDDKVLYTLDEEGNKVTPYTRIIVRKKKE